MTLANSLAGRVEACPADLIGLATNRVTQLRLAATDHPGLGLPRLAGARHDQSRFVGGDNGRAAPVCSARSSRGFFTVSSVTTSRAAISGLDRPSVLTRSTWVSRGGERGRGRHFRSAAQLGELADEPSGDGRREERFAGRDDPHGLEEPLGRDVLEQEATGAGAQRVVRTTSGDSSRQVRPGLRRRRRCRGP
jgi:hypothetical protein